MIIVAYYTPDYKVDYDKYLRPSWDKVDIKREIIEVPDRGNWSLNTFYTPSIIRKMLDKYPEDAIVKVGVDAHIYERPQLLFDIEKDNDCDVAITYRSQDPITHPECSTVLVMNNAKGRMFCDMWDKACEEKAKNLTMVISDMEVLWTVMDVLMAHVKFRKIPISYGQSWHFNKKELGIPIIEEFRSSWNHDRNRI